MKRSTAAMSCSRPKGGPSPFAPFSIAASPSRTIMPMGMSDAMTFHVAVELANSRLSHAICASPKKGAPSASRFAVFAPR